MGRPIVKLDGKYLVWSTVSDSPVTYGLTLDELREHTLDENGREGLRELEQRLRRVDEKGTSMFDDESAEDTIWLNRAGPEEEPLHRDEIVEFFVRRRERPTSKTLAEFRKDLPRCGPTCVARPDDDGCGNHCKKCWGTDYVRPMLKESNEVK